MYPWSFVPFGLAAKLTNGELLLRHCTIPFANRFPPWAVGLGSGTDAVDRCMQLSVGHCEGIHPLPGGVDEIPVNLGGMGRSASSHVGSLGEEVSPPPKRRKWLFLPGPAIGSKEDSHFPRVGVG